MPPTVLSSGLGEGGEETLGTAGAPGPARCYGSAKLRFLLGGTRRPDRERGLLECGSLLSGCARQQLSGPGERPRQRAKVVAVTAVARRCSAAQRPNRRRCATEATMVQVSRRSFPEDPFPSAHFRVHRN